MKAEEKHPDVRTAESDGLVSTSVGTLPDTASVYPANNDV